jgi:hypothetical protein
MVILRQPQFPSLLRYMRLIQGCIHPRILISKSGVGPVFCKRFRGSAPNFVVSPPIFPVAAPTIALGQKENLVCSSVECARVPFSWVIEISRRDDLHTALVIRAYYVDSLPPKKPMSNKVRGNPRKKDQRLGLSPEFWPSSSHH